jgi:hypothetical protein
MPKVMPGGTRGLACEGSSASRNLANLQRAACPDAKVGYKKTIETISGIHDVAYRNAFALAEPRCHSLEVVRSEPERLLH